MEIELRTDFDIIQRAMQLNIGFAVEGAEI